MGEEKEGEGEGRGRGGGGTCCLGARTRMATSRREGFSSSSAVARVARVAARAKLGRDPSDATPETVLEQLARREPIGADELVAAPGGVAVVKVGAATESARAIES